MQYTIAKFYRINGGSTQLKGVQPDIVLPSYVEASEWGESKEENALPWDQIDKAPYKPVNQVAEEELPQLQRAANERIENDPEFDYIFDDIERIRAEQDKTWVSLDINARKAEQEEQKALRLKRINDRLTRLGKEPLESVDAIDELDEEILEVDPYLEQAMAIGFDYIDETKLASNKAS